jgi:hypothetical protein
LLLNPCGLVRHVRKHTADAQMHKRFNEMENRCWVRGSQRVTDDIVIDEASTITIFFHLHPPSHFSHAPPRDRFLCFCRVVLGVSRTSFAVNGNGNGVQERCSRRGMDRFFDVIVCNGALVSASSKRGEGGGSGVNSGGGAHNGPQVVLT